LDFRFTEFSEVSGSALSDKVHRLTGYAIGMVLGILIGMDFRPLDPLTKVVDW